MITFDELKDIAKELNISETDVQKDYVFGWLLSYIFSKSSFSERLFLKGGNALRKGYFIEGRFSKDLDLGTPGDISIEEVQSLVKDACEYISSETGVVFQFEEDQVKEKFREWDKKRWEVIEARIRFKDIRGDLSHMVLRVSMDITKFDMPLDDIKSCMLIHPYPDADRVVCNIRCMSLEEILATKLRCLIQRQKSTDLFDFVYGTQFNPSVEVDRTRMINLFLRKTIFQKNPGFAKKTLKMLPLTIFEAFWVKSISCIQSVKIDLTLAIEKFAEELENSFKGFDGYTGNDHRYMSPEFRNLILSAGREFKKLKIMYQGTIRIVEPYSLKFKYRQSDGTENEYFYVYQLAGGSGIDWRQYLPYRIQSVEIIDETFEPREEVELSKVAEYPEERRFKGSTGRRRSKVGTQSRRRVRTLGNSYGLKYKYKCSVCGKVFERSKMNSKMNKHKNKRGYECYGGYGIYVGQYYKR